MLIINTQITGWFSGQVTASEVGGYSFNSRYKILS